MAVGDAEVTTTQDRTFPANNRDAVGVWRSDVSRTAAPRDYHKHGGQKFISRTLGVCWAVNAGIIELGILLVAEDIQAGAATIGKIAEGLIRNQPCAVTVVLEQLAHGNVSR